MPTGESLITVWVIDDDNQSGGVREGHGQGAVLRGAAVPSVRLAQGAGCERGQQRAGAARLPHQDGGSASQAAAAAALP